LEFEGGRLPDVLYLEAAREEFRMIAENDPRAAKYAEDFEELLDDALSEERSIELMRGVAEEMSLGGGFLVASKQVGPITLSA
jgi:hypothetical protein